MMHSSWISGGVEITVTTDKLNETESDADQAERHHTAVIDKLLTFPIDQP